MKKTLAALVTALLALTVSSCGTNDDAQASKAISAKIMKSQKASQSASQLFSMKQKNADCVGNGLVDKIGTAKLQKYKLLTKDLKAGQDLTAVTMSAGDAKSATDVLFGCADMPGMVQKAVAKSGQVPAAMTTCVNKALDDKNLRVVFTKVFNGKSSEAQQALIKPMMACGLGGGASPAQ